MTEQIVEDLGHRERIAYRVVCLRCSTAGPWGGRSGLDGQTMAAILWNGEWGRG